MLFSFKTRERENAEGVMLFSFVSSLSFSAHRSVLAPASKTDAKSMMFFLLLLLTSFLFVVQQETNGTTTRIKEYKEVEIACLSLFSLETRREDDTRVSQTET